MASNFRKTTSNIFLSAFVAVILVSFMFTGNEFLMSSPNEVANVGGTPIKFSEYENEFKRQMEFYKQFMGGKDLTQKQIEQYNLKNNAVNNLVARKLMSFVAKEIGAHPSLEQIKKDIKDQPYFKTNEQFDINRYKMVLSRVGMSPEEFEKETTSRLQLQIAHEVINNLPVSNSYIKEIDGIRNEKRTIQYISYMKDSLKSHIPVSKSEIDTFLKDENNLNNVTAQFEARKGSFGTPEQVQAAHILLKSDGTNDAEIKKEIEKIHKTLTPKNFTEMANKHSQDSNIDPQTQKKKGGDLGWFSRGRMVPEFEKAAFETPKGGISKPIKTQFGYHIIHIKDKKDKVVAKLDDHKEALAKLEILNTKTAALDKLSDELVNKLTEALNQNSKKQLNALKSKFGLTVLEDEEINHLDGMSEENKVEDHEFHKLFEEKIGTVHTFKSPLKVTLIRVDNFKKVAKVKIKKEGEKLPEEKTDEDKKTELVNILNRKLSQNMINHMREQTSVKIYSNRL